VQGCPDAIRRAVALRTFRRWALRIVAMPGARYCAPFSLQAVEQVVMMPFWQAMHTATHCSKSFAL
jgi:hypothetical protein